MSTFHKSRCSLSANSIKSWTIESNLITTRWQNRCSLTIIHPQKQQLGFIQRQKQLYRSFKIMVEKLWNINGAQGQGEQLYKVKTCSWQVHWTWPSCRRDAVAHPYLFGSHSTWLQTHHQFHIPRDQCRAIYLVLGSRCLNLNPNCGTHNSPVTWIQPCSTMVLEARPPIHRPIWAGYLPPGTWQATDFPMSLVSGLPSEDLIADTEVSPWPSSSLTKSWTQQQPQVLNLVPIN